MDTINISNTASDEKKSFTELIDKWTLEHPVETLAISMGLMIFVSTQYTKYVISEGVFKGNMKTFKYLEKLYYEQ